MDLVILILILTIVVVIFKKFSSFVYFMVIIDLFLRIITQIGVSLGIYEINHFISTYIPASIPVILSKYAADIFLTVLMWGYLAIYVIFEVYIVQSFIKKK
ncbi:MAG: hypothetical protein PHN72_06685 [Bacilli bacterium]|nr:hypothetical protein [Bacilli bacterium]